MLYIYVIYIYIVVVVVDDDVMLCYVISYYILYPIIASAGTRTLPRRFLSSPPLLWESQRAPIPRVPLSNLTRPIDGPFMGKRYENMETYNIYDKMYGKINGKSGFYHGME